MGSFAGSGSVALSAALRRSEAFKKGKMDGREQTTVAEDGPKRWPRHRGWPRCLQIQY